MHLWYKQRSNMNRWGFYPLFFLTLALIGCVETIVMDPYERDMPVMVNCVLDLDSEVQTLYLQYVTGKATKGYLPIENAKVYIALDEKDVKDTVFFYRFENNEWRTPHDSKKRIWYGKHCKLLVEIPGIDPIWSELTIPKNYFINLKKGVYHYGGSDEKDHYTMQFNMFHGKEQITTSPVWITALKGWHSETESRDDHYPYIVTDHPLADDFNINGKQFSDLALEGDIDYPHRAYYSWLAFKNMRRLMPELPLHDSFVRIEHLDTNFFHVLAGPLESKRCDMRDHFDFYFLSEELDEYLRNVYTKNFGLDHDLTRIYSSDNAYSNIEGGVGIFGFFTRKSMVVF